MSFRSWFWPTLSSDQYRREREGKSEPIRMPERPAPTEEQPGRADVVVRLDPLSARDKQDAAPAPPARSADSTGNRFVIAMATYKARLLHRSTTKS
jgi:hypothetical protein